jgi:hypothetical protein
LVVVAVLPSFGIPAAVVLFGCSPSPIDDDTIEEGAGEGINSLYIKWLIGAVSTV